MGLSEKGCNWPDTRSGAWREGPVVTALNDFAIPFEDVSLKPTVTNQSHAVTPLIGHSPRGVVAGW
jgi:hypothetical protein